MLAKTIIFVLLANLALGCLYERVGSAEKRAVHWAYEGEAGPSNWGNLDPSYALCGSGKKQTPIALNVDDSTEYSIGKIF